MLYPTMPARMKQYNNFACLLVNRADVASLETITVKAAQAKIFQIRLSVMFFSNDVINLMTQKLIIALNQAILAASIGSFPNGAA